MNKILKVLALGAMAFSLFRFSGSESENSGVRNRIL